MVEANRTNKHMRNVQRKKSNFSYGELSCETFTDGILGVQSFLPWERTEDVALFVIR